MPWGYMFRNENSRCTASNAMCSLQFKLCRNAIAQAELSGGSSRESLRSPFLRITGLTATMEPPS